jgi:hypothetical protein
LPFANARVTIQKTTTLSAGPKSFKEALQTYNSIHDDSNILKNPPRIPTTISTAATAIPTTSTRSKTTTPTPNQPIQSSTTATTATKSKSPKAKAATAVAAEIINKRISTTVPVAIKQN